MDAPILFLVDDEPEVLASLAVARERRFGADYRIVTDPSSTSALERLEPARDRGEEVALRMVGPNARALPRGLALRYGALILRLDSVQQAVDEAQQQDDEDRARDHPDPLEPAMEDLSHEPAKQIGDSTDEAGPNEAVGDLV
jgi:hypothetical protein